VSPPINEKLMKSEQAIASHPIKKLAAKNFPIAGERKEPYFLVRSF
jgi:hypothetical protein